MTRSIKRLGAALAGALILAGCTASQDETAAGTGDGGASAAGFSCENTIAPPPGFSGSRGLATDGQELFALRDNGPRLNDVGLSLSISAGINGRLNELAVLPQSAGLNPTALLVDATSFYFLQSVGGELGLYKMSRAGGAPQKLAAAELKEGLWFPRSTTPIARDESHVYFYAKGELARVPLAGGNVETSGVPMGSTLNMSMVVDRDSIYVATSSSGAGDVSVARLSKNWVRTPWGDDCAGCRKWDVQEDNFYYHLPDCGYEGVGLFVSNGVYLTCSSPSGGAIYRAPITEGQAASKADDWTHPRVLVALRVHSAGEGNLAIFVKDGTVYSAEGPAVFKIPPGGQASKILTLETSPTPVSHMISDGQNLYVGSRACGVQKVAL